MSVRLPALLYAVCALIPLHIAPAEAQNQRNLILFVPDGLRALSVTPEATPAIAAVRDKGVNFANPHSLFPTFTMANASGLSTGHFIGDTGAFSNTIYTGFPVAHASSSVTPFIEANPVLGDIDEHFSGNFVDEDAILLAARNQNFSTAAIGKVGPILMFDHTDRTGDKTITVDDSTGSPGGIPLSQAIQNALTAAGLPLAAPKRGANGKVGDASTPGTTEANVEQQKYFADVAAKVVLPMFKAQNKPFVLVFWSRDPDGTQHNQGDSLLKLEPGINGPTSRAAIKNADDNLAQLRAALDELGLAANTDIVIAADHGFSTISKESKTSRAAQASYQGVPSGLLPPGFLAIDIAKALALPLHDPDDRNAAVSDGKYPKRGNGLIGSDPEKPDVVVASNGGSDLVYIPGKDRAVTAKVVNALLEQDYVSGLFVDDALGSYDGTLPLSAINMLGAPRATSDLQRVIDRNPVAIRKAVGLVRHPDDRHQLAEHGLAHSGPAGGFGVGRNAVATAIGGRHRLIDHFLDERLERTGRHHLLDTFPRPLQCLGLVREIFPEIIHVGDVPGFLDVVKNRAHLRRSVGIFDWRGCRHRQLQGYDLGYCSGRG